PPSCDDQLVWLEIKVLLNAIAVEIAPYAVGAAPVVRVRGWGLRDRYANRRTALRVTRWHVEAATVAEEHIARALLDGACKEVGIAIAVQIDHRRSGSARHTTVGEDSVTLQ